jgi:pSer/pThr/pTyr-binding forkhead associated (FHA) protein
MSQPGVEVSQPRLPRLRLKVLQSPTSSAEKEKLITTFPFVIGRDGCDFNIPDQRISRRHAEITVRDGKFFVTDLESRNGTFIGTTKLPPHTPTPLNGSTVVRLGQQTQIELEPQ